MTSPNRKTSGGKGDKDRGSLAKRRESPFYWRSACCNAHVSTPGGEGVHLCQKCKKPCELAED
jgi:hypothetical protein